MLADLSLSLPALALMNRRGGAVGPLIQLSAATIADTASIGDTIGTLSVSGGTGTYTFTLTSNPGGLFSITGTSLKVAAALSTGSDAITVHADNGAGGIVDRVLLITVTHTSGGSGAALQFNVASNSMYIPLLEDI